MGHIHENYDYVTTVFLVHDGKVLFANHPRYGKWVPIGGHIELDEDPEEALFREIKEETGLEAEILSEKPDVIPGSDTKLIFRPNYVDVYDANPPHRHIAFIYFARTKSDAFVKSDEHVEIKWLNLEDLQDPAYDLTPTLKFYAAKAIEADKEY